MPCSAPSFTSESSLARSVSLSSFEERLLITREQLPVNRLIQEVRVAKFLGCIILCWVSLVLSRTFPSINIADRVPLSVATRPASPGPHSWPSDSSSACLRRTSPHLRHLPLTELDVVVSSRA